MIKVGRKFIVLNVCRCYFIGGFGFYCSGDYFSIVMEKKVK